MPARNSSIELRHKNVDHDPTSSFEALLNQARALHPSLVTWETLINIAQSAPVAAGQFSNPEPPGGFGPLSCEPDNRRRGNQSSVTYLV